MKNIGSLGIRGDGSQMMWPEPSSNTRLSRSPREFPKSQNIETYFEKVEGDDAYNEPMIFEVKIYAHESKGRIFTVREAEHNDGEEFNAERRAAVVDRIVEKYQLSYDEQCENIYSCDSHERLWYKGAPFHGRGVYDQELGHYIAVDESHWDTVKALPQYEVEKRIFGETLSPSDSNTQPRLGIIRQVCNGHCYHTRAIRAARNRAGLFYLLRNCRGTIADRKTHLMSEACAFV